MEKDPLLVFKESVNTILRSCHDLTDRNGALTESYLEFTSTHTPHDPLLLPFLNDFGVQTKHNINKFAEDYDANFPVVKEKSDLLQQYISSLKQDYTEQRDHFKASEASFRQQFEMIEAKARHFQTLLKAQEEQYTAQIQVIEEENKKQLESLQTQVKEQETSKLAYRISIEELKKREGEYISHKMDLENALKSTRKICMDKQKKLSQDKEDLEKKIQESEAASKISLLARKGIMKQQHERSKAQTEAVETLGKKVSDYTDAASKLVFSQDPARIITKRNVLGGRNKKRKSVNVRHGK